RAHHHASEFAGGEVHLVGALRTAEQPERRWPLLARGVEARGGRGERLVPGAGCERSAPFLAHEWLVETLVRLHGRKLPQALVIGHNAGEIGDRVVVAAPFVLRTAAGTATPLLDWMKWLTSIEA